MTATTFSGSGANLTSIPVSAIPDITVLSPVSGILKGSGSSIVAAVAGTDYVTPASPAFTGQVRMDSHYGAITADSDGATITFDMGASDKHAVTLAGNRTLAVTGDQIGQSFTLLLTQDATGSRTVTWWSGIHWPEGSVPSLTTTPNKTDLFTFIKRGSGSYIGLPVGFDI